jgi:hypothetical protein
MGKGHLEMVEYVSHVDVFLDAGVNQYSSHVFGNLYNTSDDEESQEPSTADILRKKRAARKDRQRDTQRPQTKERTPGLPLRLHSLS